MNYHLNLYIPEFYEKESKKQLKQKEINDILYYLFGAVNYNKFYEKRNNGQYIIIDKVNENNLIERYYIGLSRESYEESRNSFLLQSLPKTISDFIEDEEHSNKHLVYYIRDIIENFNSTTLYACKLINTAGITILNKEELKLSEKNIFMDPKIPFKDIREIRKHRLISKKKNPSNNSTQFEEEENEISIYAKTYGANGRESLMIALALRQMYPYKKMNYYLVNETDEKHKAKLEETIRKILEINKIEIIDDREPINFENNYDQKAKRDQRTFKFNLLKKWGNKKCYLCDCEIENLIIASHIHRVTDILKSELSEEEKQRQVVSGENGLWLCANHDLLFEYGNIYFEDRKLYYSNKMEENELNYIKDITNKESTENLKNNLLNGVIISEEFYTEEMGKYLNLHKLRTNTDIK